MKRMFGGRVSAFFDARVIAGFCGVVLSVATHELFHILVHWGEIDSIRLFPDRHAIVEIAFTPSAPYNLMLEEGIAYAITMVTLLLTAMLVADIHDAREKKSVTQIIFTKDSLQYQYKQDEPTALGHLSSILEVDPLT